MPSPVSAQYLDYIHYRLKMLQRAMDVYGTAKYTRLNLNKYINSNRASDKTPVTLTGNRPSLIHMGDAKTPLNSPIRIKKHLRAPNTYCLSHENWSTASESLVSFFFN